LALMVLKVQDFHIELMQDRRSSRPSGAAFIVPVAVALNA
jgi:hypothetical protein